MRLFIVTVYRHEADQTGAVCLPFEEFGDILVRANDEAAALRLAHQVAKERFRAGEWTVAEISVDGPEAVLIAQYGGD